MIVNIVPSIRDNTFVFEIPQSADLWIGFKLTYITNNNSLTVITLSIDGNNHPINTWQQEINPPSVYFVNLSVFGMAEFPMNACNLTLTVSPIASVCLLELFTQPKYPEYEKKLSERISETHNEVNLIMKRKYPNYERKYK